MSLIIEKEAPWALVTGATGGLGIQFCELLAARGYRLVATARDTARLAALREQIPQVQLALAGDLTDPVCLRNLIRHLKRDQIEPEVLINNAGFGLYGETLKQPTLDEQNLVDLNIQTLTTLTLEFAKLMQRKNKGYILNVASIAAFMPCPYLSVYGASKAYVLQFSEALHDLRALELLESLTSREHVMELVEGGLSRELTFFSYPAEASYLLDLRSRVNAEIKALSR